MTKQIFLLSFLLATFATSAYAETITCIGEAISSRAIGGNQALTSAFADSAIDDNCFFFSNSPIGRQIARVCPIRDIHSFEEPGPSCRIKAVIVKKRGFNVITRIIKIERQPRGAQSPTKGNFFRVNSRCYDEDNKLDVSKEFSNVKQYVRNSKVKTSELQLLLSKMVEEYRYNGKIDGSFNDELAKSLCKSITLYIGIGVADINRILDAPRFIKWLYEVVNANETGGEFPD